MHVTTLEPNTEHAVQLMEWFEQEWGSIDPFDGTIAHITTPAPLIATLGKRLIGGLAFTSAYDDTRQPTVWINALYVSAAYRHSGVGSQLIAAAEQSALQHGVDLLNVYTDKPELYLKLAWTIHSDRPPNTVLRKSLV